MIKTPKLVDSDLAVQMVLEDENTRKSVFEQHTYRQAENLRKSQSPRVDKINWNGILTQKLGNGFEFNKKACFVCGSLNHLIKDCNFYENKMVGNFVLNNMRRVTGQREVRPSGQVPVNIAKKSSSRAAASISTTRPVNTDAPKSKVNDASPIKYSYFKAHSPIRRAFNQKLAAKTNNLNGKVKTARVNNVTTAGSKAVVNGNPQYALQDQGIFDSGCSRHMTGNKSYLIDYQDVDGGFVAFAGSPKGGKITKKTECLVLSPDFKLLDESQVLLKVPRQNNMYSFDLNNIVPSGGLTCLFAKATIDESNLWHRRLGHINFKTMNKLVRGNLVRGLPLKLFENDHTCVACQKEKQHRASCKTKLFCRMKGIKREFSVSRTPQQNGVAERKNRTLIEAARTMLADSLLPTTFWAEAVNTACYVQNRVLVTKPHNKTPYELLLGRPPSISFMRPFGCHVTILNTLDPLGKFDGKADKGFLVGYSINSKAFRVFNTRTRKVEENLHINFLENKPNVAGNGPEWLFDIDSLTKSMNYEPVTVGNQTNDNADNKDADEVPGKGDDDLSEINDQQRIDSSTQDINTVGPKTGIFSGAYNDEDVGAKADLNNLATTMNVSPIPTTRIHKDHLKDQIIGDINSATQTRRMTKITKEHAMAKPKKVIQALTDPSWIEAMQEELLQFKLQKVWTLVDLLKGKRAIGTKWVYRNKKDERGIVVRNKARLVAQGYTQEEGIDYDEVFVPVARIEAIGLFLACASFMGLIVYQMDVKSAFLYGTIKEEVYVCQPLSFEDPQFPDKVYKVEKASYRLHQAPRAWYETLFTYLLENRFRRGTIDKTLFIKKDRGDILLVQMSSMKELTFFLGLQVQQKEDGIFISQDKYVADILKKFDFTTIKAASTPIETNKALNKYEEAEDMDVHLYRSMIGSLMYLTSSMPDIMFAICACARDSPFDLEAFSDSDYAGASLDRKSTTGGCQFLGKRLISWQCKKQIIVTNSTTEAEYVVAANCCGQELWIQN
ncbi:putative ribonuclease H-like domain-containing protein [Tanacetum coccineum]